MCEKTSFFAAGGGAEVGLLHFGTSLPLSLSSSSSPSEDSDEEECCMTTRLSSSKPFVCHLDLGETV